MPVAVCHHNFHMHAIGCRDIVIASDILGDSDLALDQRSEEPHSSAVRNQLVQCRGIEVDKCLTSRPMGRTSILRLDP